MTPGGCWLRRGQIVSDRYRVDEMLGSGGMGFVVAATDLQRSRRVALKLPHRDRMRSVRDVARFVREARSAACLTSRHVPRIYETGTVRSDDVTIPFIALEYLEGADLATWLATRGPLGVATAANIVVQACHAIAEAHAHGIVHRDLKPANLMLTVAESGDVLVKVLDFGICKARGETANQLTATGALVGSPAYMPPEQMRPSTTVDARGDLWSLGIVLYEAVTGRRPFESAVFPDLCLKILLDDMPPLPEELAPAFVEVVRRCLEKEPAARYQSAAELADALAPFAEPTLAISATDLELLIVHAPPDLEPAPYVTPRRRPLALGLWAAALAIVVAMSTLPEPEPPATVAPRIESVAIDPVVAPAPPPTAPPVTPPTATRASSVVQRARRVVRGMEPPPPVASASRSEQPAARDPLASPF